MESKMSSREGSFHSMSGNTGEAGSTALQAAFTERQQELTVIESLIANTIVVTDVEKAKYELELRNYQRVPAENVAASFGSSVENGISVQEAALRLQRNGLNQLQPPRVRPVWIKLLLSLFGGFAPVRTIFLSNSPPHPCVLTVTSTISAYLLVQLLWFATFFVFLSWEPFGTPPSNVYNLVLAIVLLIVIVSSSLFTFFQELQSSRVLSVFKQMLPEKCIVIRGGVAALLPASQLVLGDLIQLQAGSRVPADIRIVTASNVKVDKSMLTGEVEPVKLTDKATNHITLLEATNTAFMGTSIVEGSGLGVVFAVGQQTQLAKIAVQSSGDSKATSLQRELNRFVLIIGSFAFLTGGIVMAVWGGWLNKEHEGFMNTATMIANAISVIVAFVPEGLPLALSVGLTIIARRLCSACFVLVKQLSTVETLGSVSLIASDKTGTLTQNKMTVVNLITGSTDDAVTVTGKTEWLTTHKTTPFIRAVAISALCNQASIKARGVGRTETEESVDVEIAFDVEPVIVGGNGIDRALLGWALLYDLATVRATSSVVATVPFSSEKKVAMSIIRDNVSFQATVLLKGAPEYVLQACTHYYRADGSVAGLSEAIMAEFMDAQDKLAGRGRRLVALAELPLSLEEFSPLYTFTTDPTNFPTAGMRLVCMVAVSDPPRVGVSDTIRQLRGAGIRIAMVTGDASSTALAIAKEVGIVTAAKPDVIKTAKAAGGRVASTLAGAFIAPANDPKPRSPSESTMVSSEVTSAAIVVQGPQLYEIGADAWDYIFKHKELVFCRTTPEQKLQIVKQCQARGHRVGVTGDGVNDAPAMKAADIGIAMNSGSDVARDASKIVLLNDDFCSIIHGVREGRLIFSNLRKVIAYQIAAGCWSEVLPVLACFFLGMPQPLSSFLMITISCLSDVFAGIALMYEPAEHDVMCAPPRDVRRSKLVDFQLITYAYFFMGNCQSIGAFVNWFSYMQSRGPTGTTPDPLPVDDDGSAGPFPAGYLPSQLTFAWNFGLNSNALGADEVAALNTASSVFYVTLIVSQLAHLLSVRRSGSPYFSDLRGFPSWADWFAALPRYLIPPTPIVGAWVGALATAIILTEVKAINAVTGTDHVPLKYWGAAFGWAAAIFLLAEARKWIVYLFPHWWIVRWGKGELRREAAGNNEQK